MFSSKKGVSLITVLLFMLVATIAATATFKWLTSENRSSATRMLRQEAYQSALAGIDNARAWMSNNANDVGAVIKQYLDTTSNKRKPILLNKALNPFNTNGQNYSVWLTGVNTESSTYKLKLISKGTARNGAEHTEAAIIKVNGLYKVKIPVDNAKFTFNKAFHGASSGITGQDIIGSGNINGDWTYSNNPQIKGDMIVTGFAEYGSSMQHYGDFYLAGNLINKAGNTTYGTAGVDTTAVYIGGNVTCPDGNFIKVYGDLYVRGDISVKCKVDVSGNFTLGGKITRENDLYVNVGKNWVFTKRIQEQLELTNYVNNNTNFSIGRNLYLPYKIKAYCGNDCGDKEGKRGFIVGGNVYQYESSPFVLNTQSGQAHFNQGYMNYGAYMDGYTRPFNVGNKPNCSDDHANCKRGRIFSFKAADIPEEHVSEWSPTDNVLKDIGDNYWQRINKLKRYGKMIDSTTNPHRVPDPIQTKNEVDWKALTANTYCGQKGFSIGESFNFTNSNIQKLNKCYAKAKDENKLYNDEYLIIKWKYWQIEGTETEKLVGKFVIYAPDPVGQTVLPPTASGSVVMLYLEQGTIMPKENGQLQGRSGEYNYLIYSKGDIGEINKLHIKGSVILSNGKKLHKYQGGCNLEYNGDVLKSLAKAGIIKENPEYTKLTGDTDDEGNYIAENYKDDIYYIATSPQLSISLESQYETREKIEATGDNSTETAAIDSSAMILPRIIYLTKDPVGKLSDYYSIVYLNTKGPQEQLNESNASCDPHLNTSTYLYDGDNTLSSEIYNCKYSSQTYGDLPFYVVVSGEKGKVPAVSLSTDQAEITTSGTVTVSAQVETSTRAQPIKIDISVSKAPEGWTIVPVSGATMELRQDLGTDKVYTLTLKPNVQVQDLFIVTTSPTAKQGSVYFYLMSPMEGCTITAPSWERVLMTGFISVNRGSIGQYCSISGNTSICQEKGYDEKARALDCDNLATGEWIRAFGTNVTVLQENNQWSVGTNTTISLKDQNNTPSYCELVLPTENNSITRTEENQEYTLYASLKRRKYTLTVKTKGNENKYTKVSVLYRDGGDEYTDATSELCNENNDGDLNCEVYAGWDIKTTYTLEGTDEFSRWECEGNNCPVPAINSTEYSLPQITSNNTITAVFNEKDNHCFYEDFTNLTAFCSGSTTKCINDCEGSNGSCTVSGVSANWQLMYPNNKNGANIEPLIQNGYIKSGSNVLNENSTIILSTKEAGIHGTMTSLIQTTVLEDNTKSLNSGFIFSSDAIASTFTILNIYGNSSNNNALTVRVCKGSVNNNAAKNENCTDQTLKDASSNTISMNSEDMIKLKVELTLSNKLNITATVNGYTGYAELDISTYLGSRDEHSRYVGFDISDPSFKIYDIGWSSLYFSDECFENPKISCSFEANYLGGLVPKNKNVTPWVGLSSWYEANNCTLTYYYNGCDNSTGNSSWGCEGNHFMFYLYNTWRNEYDADGNYFGKELPDSIYNFSEGDEHGTTQTYSYNTYGRPVTVTRAINDAKVKISCSGQSSLNGAWSSCGSFWVGDLVGCSQNAEILSTSSTPKYGTAGDELEIPVSDYDGILNLRSATLWINISNYTETDNDKIILYLKDVNGKLSLPREINANGNQSFYIKDMSNLEGFNPQKVKSIILKSSLYPYQVNSIISSCPNALGINNCEATYNGISWILTSTITNIEGAAANGCSVSEHSTKKLDNISCPENGVFTFAEADLYDEVNSKGNAITRSFDITAKSEDGGLVSCTTTPVTIEPVEVDCSIDKTIVEAGDGMPTLTYTFSGCPKGGCDYTLDVGSEESVSGTTSGSGTWTPTVNVIPALKADTYTYSITTFGAKKECGRVTVKPASPAQASNCNLENYKFTADVVPASDGSEWKMQVAVFYNGVEVKKEPKEPKKGKTDKFEQDIPTKDLIPGQYSAQLFLNGEKVSNCLLPFDVAGSSSSSSSAISSSSEASISVKCPGTITGKKPGDRIEVAATITNCTNCEIQILDGSETKNSNNDLYFYDYSATAPKTYTLKASSNGTSKTCDFKVAYVIPSSSSVASSSSAASNTCKDLPDQIIPKNNDNYNLNINNFTNGCYNINTGKSCKHVQIQANVSTGTGTFKINGTTFDCGK